ncbi:hypothetical protein ACQPZJ_24305 [Actinoplanes sp. CA-054009]
MRRFRESEVRALLEAELDLEAGLDHAMEYASVAASSGRAGRSGHAGTPTGDVDVPAAVVNAYLATSDEGVARRVFAALDAVAAALGYDRVDEIEVRRGSFWRRARGFASRLRTSEELSSRLIKVERAVELAHLDGRQADINEKEANAVTQLIQSLENVPDACLQVGSLLIIKQTQANGSPTLFSRRLSPMEMRALERYPEIQGNPSKVPAALAA